MSIADELALLANTKESLRVAIGLSTSIPFSQYAANVPWGSEGVPATASVFDFTNNRYAKDGRAVYLDDMPSQFIRLSSATMWGDGQLVEVANNVPRISAKGLLIEPQRTNVILHNNNLLDPYYGPGLEGSPKATIVKEGTYNWQVSADGFLTAVSLFSELTSQGVLSLSMGVVTQEQQVTLTTRRTGAVGHAGQAVAVLELDGTVTNGNPEAVISTYKDGNRFGFTRVESTLSPAVRTAFRVGHADAPEAYTCYLPQWEVGEGCTSGIVTGDTPVTRSPDILNIPLLPSQTVTGDWDAGVTYTVDGGIATFAGHGYIRNITVEEL